MTGKFDVATRAFIYGLICVATVVAVYTAALKIRHDAAGLRDPPVVVDQFVCSDRPESHDLDFGRVPTQVGHPRRAADKNEVDLEKIDFGDLDMTVVSIV